MGITLFTFSGLLAPLQQLAAWLGGATVSARARLARASQPPGRACAVRSAATWRPGTRSALPSSRAVRPLRAVPAVRVVRATEDHALSGAGRMVISGRMADVCAELERLAAVEAGRPC